MIDLHSHTTYSDGTLTPAALVQEALAAGLKALAITDHDTLAGWDEALAAAGEALLIVPGVELSTTAQGRSLHVLGFYPNRSALAAALQGRLAARRERAMAMAERLATLGYPIVLPPMEGNRAPGRPHLAAAMVAAGYATSVNEAFDRWLGDQGPAYVPYDEFSAVEGIRLLRDCGAVPVWAHPSLFRGGTVETQLPPLLEAGLMGLEVYHPTHSPSDVRRLEALCQRYGLVMTGGSDYHGPSPEAKGKGAIHLNQLQLPLTLLDPLQQARQSMSY